MENMLRSLVLFVWSVLFGFFSWMAYLDDTMAPSHKMMIVIGLLLVLGAYLAFELFTQKTNAPSPLKKAPTTNQADERILRRLQASAQDGGSAEPAAHFKQQSSTVHSGKNFQGGKPSTRPILPDHNP